MWSKNFIILTKKTFAGAAKYTDCIFAEGQHFPNECPRHDTKQSDGEASVMLEIWGVWSTPSLPSLSGSLRLEVVASDRDLTMGQIELNCALALNWIVWNRPVFIFDCVFKLRFYAKLNCLKLNNFDI